MRFFTDVLNKVIIEMRLAVRKAELLDQPTEEVEKHLENYRAVLKESGSIMRTAIAEAGQLGLDLRKVGAK